MDTYLTARASRTLNTFSKKLASVLRDPAKARAITESGTPGGALVAAKVNANRRGRAFARDKGRAPNFREVNYMRGLKANDTFRAKARVAGSPERGKLKAIRASGAARPSAAMDSRMAVLAAQERKRTRGWGTWPKTPPRGNRAADVFNPGARPR